MMTTNYREMLGIMTLENACGIARESRNLKQKKAIKNIKYCANDQWQFVNSWYDCKDESARTYMMNARELFNTIYDESQKNLYNEGSVSWGSHVESYLKDIRFCGKDFLQKVTFYYTAKLLEESVEEVDGTEEDAQRVLEDLKTLKAEIFGESVWNLESILDHICYDVIDGDNLVECVANVSNREVKKTRKNEKWVSLPKNIAIILSQYLKGKEANLEATESRTKITYKNDKVNLILNLGTNPYLWCVK